MQTPLRSRIGLFEGGYGTARLFYLVDDYHYYYKTFAHFLAASRYLSIREVQAQNRSTQQRCQRTSDKIGLWDPVLLDQVSKQVYVQTVPPDLPSRLAHIPHEQVGHYAVGHWVLLERVSG